MPTLYFVPAALLAAGLVVGAPPEVAVTAKTTPPEANVSPNPALLQRSYAVADLVVPLTRAASAPAKGSDKPELPGPEIAEIEQADRLCQLMVRTIEPGNWIQGGRGNFGYEARTRTLLVTQTPAVQERIAALLDELRKAQEVEVALEVRFITVSEAYLNRVNVSVDVNPKAFAPDGRGNSVVMREPVEPLRAIIPRSVGQSLLNDRQVYLLMDAVQGERSASVMQAPRMTLMNGQTCNLEIGERQYFVTGVDVVRTADGYTARPKNEQIHLGKHITAQPVVSPDRHIVQLYFKVEESELASSAVAIYPVTVPTPDTGRKMAPFTQFVQQPNVATHKIEKMAAIPDGQTLLFTGQRKVRQAHVENLNPLARLPLLGSLFHDNKYRPEEAVQELILVTPRVLALRENGNPATTQAATQQAYEHLQQLTPGSRLADMAVATLKEPATKTTDVIVQDLSVTPLPAKAAEPLVPGAATLAHNPVTQAQNTVTLGQTAAPPPLSARNVIQASHVETPQANAPAAHGLLPASYLEGAPVPAPAARPAPPAVNSAPVVANPTAPNGEVSTWRRTEVMASLRKAYREARAEGRTAEAERIALAMRTVDPNCSLEEPK
jgi:general secretion pathway protein D